MLTFGDSCISCNRPSPAALCTFPAWLILSAAWVQVSALTLIYELDGAGHLHLLPRLFTHVHNLRNSQLLQIHYHLWHGGLTTCDRYICTFLWPYYRANKDFAPSKLWASFPPSQRADLPQHGRTTGFPLWPHRFHPYQCLDDH